MRNHLRTVCLNLMAALTVLIIPVSSFAAGMPSEGESHGASIPFTFLMLAILLVAAKFGGITEKFGQPSVVGELMAGIMLSVAGFLGFQLINDMRHNTSLEFLAELGAVILLFQIGLESNLSQMKKVGTRALMVALIGVVVPFSLGTFLLGPVFFPQASQVTYLFIGASLVATSVGITASVYQGAGVQKLKASQTVLGAAVIDDVLGLLILAVVSALASGGVVTPMFVATLSLKAFAFLGLAVIFGGTLAKYVSKIFNMINTGTGMKLALAITFALVFAYIASLVGLAPIVGAFAAGLILDQVHFKTFNLPEIAYDLKNLRGFNKEEKEKIDSLIEKHQHGHVEELVKNIGMLIVPVFFVFTGLMVDAASLLNPSVYIYGIIITVAAIAGKIIAGVAAEGTRLEKLFVGVSMIPRGEVGLIFAATGKALGAIPSDIFSTIILVIILSTLIPPTFINKLAIQLKNKDKKDKPALASV